MRCSGDNMKSSLIVMDSYIHIKENEKVKKEM